MFFENIYQGTLLLMDVNVLLAILIGTVSGTIVGALPGLTSTLGVALLIPFTFGLPPPTAFGLLGGMYCSSIYGGSITAILINIPGTGSAAATTLDGYPMTQKGESGKALATAIISSFIGGMFSTLALLLIAPPLSAIALRFGPPETFWISVFGLTIIASISGRSMRKGLLSGGIGLLLSTIGMDAQVGYMRFTMGYIELYEGIALVLALVGFFSLPEVFAMVQDKKEMRVINSDIGPVKLSGKEMRSLVGCWFQSSVIGTLIGIIPGIGTPVACYVSYNEARRRSKTPEKFGTGIIEGVAAPEAANNAVEGGSFVPLLTLGIPGSAQTAVYLGAMTIQGLRPGPSLFRDQGAITYSIILGLVIANIFMFIVGYGGVRWFVKLLNIPKAVMVPLIVTFSVIGAYAINGRIFDICVMALLGLAGYVMKRNGMPVAPAVLAMILGPIGENAFIQTHSIFKSNYWLFFTRPICVVLMGVTVISIVMTIRANRKEQRRARESGLEGSTQGSSV